jgi:large-conductance mechanosensitive channel
MYFVLGDPTGHKKYANWQQAQQAQQRGAHVIRYGAFLQAIINLTIQVWIVFILVRSWMRFRKRITQR